MPKLCAGTPGIQPRTNGENWFVYLAYFAVSPPRFPPADAAPTELESYLLYQLQICRAYGAGLNYVAPLG